MNVYGKTTDDLKTAIRAHILVLGEYEPEELYKAYSGWLAEEETMPTPAGIKKRIPKRKPKYELVEVDESQADERTYFLAGKHYKRVKAGDNVQAIASDTVKRIG